MMEYQYDVDLEYTVKSNCPLEPCTSFDAFGLNSDLLKGIGECGFDQPTVVQQYAIKQMILPDRNVVVESGLGE